MDLRDDYVCLLRSCLEDATDWHAVERCFRKGVDEEEGIEDSRPLVFAFAYMLVSSRRDQIRERTGVFGAQFEIGESIFPAPLAEIPDEMLEVWEAYADATAEFPLAASRLNDLLWVRRHGEPAVDHARRGYDAYMAVAQAGEGMGMVDCILRAIEIAVEINDKQRLQAATALALEVSRVEIEDRSERRPGIPLTLLEAVVDLKSEQRPVGLVGMIDAAGERYGEDPFIAQSVSELRQALSDPEEREALQRREVALAGGGTGGRRDPEVLPPPAGARSGPDQRVHRDCRGDPARDAVLRPRRLRPEAAHSRGRGPAGGSGFPPAQLRQLRFLGGRARALRLRRAPERRR